MKISKPVSKIFSSRASQSVGKPHMVFRPRFGHYRQQMAALMKELNAMSNSDPNKVVLKRFLGSQSVQVTLDKSGRICLPEEMARVAGISDAAVLVGMLDKFEIWSPERYDKVFAAVNVIAPEAMWVME